MLEVKSRPRLSSTFAFAFVRRYPGGIGGRGRPDTGAQSTVPSGKRERVRGRGGPGRQQVCETRGGQNVPNVHSLFVCRHGRDMDTFSHRGFVNSHWEPAIEDEATKKKRPAPFIGISLFRLYLNAGTGSRYPWIRIGNKGNLGIGLLFDSDCFHLLFFYSEISARNGRNEIRGRWGDFLVSSINNKRVVELTQISVSILISRIRRKNLWSLRKGEERERFRLSRARKSRLLGWVSIVVDPRTGY